MNEEFNILLPLLPACNSSPSSLLYELTFSMVEAVVFQNRRGNPWLWNVRFLTVMLKQLTKYTVSTGFDRSNNWLLALFRYKIGVPLTVLLPSMNWVSSARVSPSISKFQRFPLMVLFLMVLYGELRMAIP